MVQCNFTNVGSKVHSWDEKFSPIESQWIMHINHYSVTAGKYCYVMGAWTWGTQLINYFVLGVILLSDSSPNTTQTSVLLTHLK